MMEPIFNMYNLVIISLIVSVLFGLIRSLPFSAEYVDFEEEIKIPASGFIKGIFNSKSQGFRVKEHVKLPPTCSVIELTNLPISNASPLMGPPVFTLSSNALHTGHMSWSNGREHLSFVKHSSGGRGNWIIGTQAGVDSGYVFIDSPYYAQTPVGLENPEGYWKWLIDGKWTEQPQMEAECKDLKAISSFYSVEYFTEQGTFISTSLYLVDEFTGFLLDQEAGQWSRIDDIEEIVSLGSPINLIHTDLTHPTLLVNAEHSIDNGWRMTLRELETKTHVEHSVLLHRDGTLPPGYMFKPYATKQKLLHNQQLASKMQSSVVGDFLWLYYNARSSKANEFMEKIDELLVECVAVQGDRLVFKYYPTNRLDAMRQSVLAQNTDFLVVRMLKGDKIEAKLADREVQVLTGIFIGKEIEQFVWDFIFYKEKALPSVSACFMYHAAVSIPNALLYAAELLCVLAGGKPVALVQYGSPSDHQWKFPLVQKITRGIAAASHLYDDFPVNMMVFTYETAETLVVYRKNREYLADLLLPYHQAQALHLLPYANSHPDIEPETIYRDQVYNAAWNGLVLGYPQHFVTTYVEDFPNNLPVEVKREIFSTAVFELREHFEKYANDDEKELKIMLGNDEPVNKVMMKTVFSTA